MEIFRAISVLHQGRPWSSFAKRPPSLAGDLRSWKTSSKTAASCALSVVTDQCHQNVIWHQPHFPTFYIFFAPNTRLFAFPNSHLKTSTFTSDRASFAWVLNSKALLSAIWIRILSLVALLFSFDTSAIKDELVPSWSIDGDITRGQSGALRANKMIIY